MLSVSETSPGRVVFRGAHITDYKTGVALFEKITPRPTFLFFKPYKKDAKILIS